MNSYVTGAMIKRLREERSLTQAQLGDILGVGDKCVSKWETGRGYPDVSLLEPLAAALGVSVIELMSGESTVNTNRSFNMLRMKFYVCPVCGNVITGTGEAVISCHGITLPPQEADAPADDRAVTVEKVEDEYYVTVSHEMNKEHYISFIAAVRDDSCEIKKLYPEGAAEARFKISRTRRLYYYCNRHGLFAVPVSGKTFGGKQKSQTGV